ncbi:hypothetical protein PM082_006214 [Marasmius tenuissimus]|nr:hypothetical protein PM082_006214 [Marasmius tenuissimus]
MTTQHIPVHGNYHGYYSKRPSVTDPRLAALPKDTFTGKRVLDVGCNEGWVTVEIAQKWRAAKVTGVDIDESLIRAAWRRRLTVWSQQAPSPSQQQKKRKRDDEPQVDDVPDSDWNYFPASFEHTFGPLPVPPSRNRGKTVFPHNISFRAGDWVTELDAVPEDKEGYDVVVAFSISKWIHLNGGDPGLTSFFQRVHDVLKPGGVFILEPQPWESYRKARRILSSADVQRDVEVTIRPENFSDVLGKLGFGPPKRVDVSTGGEAGEGFHRPIEMYTRP